jgi:hypothetical protein
MNVKKNILLRINEGKYASGVKGSDGGEKKYTFGKCRVV